MQTVFWLVKNSIENLPPSFPTPDALIPPKGTLKSLCYQIIINKDFNKILIFTYNKPTINPNCTSL